MTWDQNFTSNLAPKIGQQFGTKLSSVDFDDTTVDLMAAINDSLCVYGFYTFYFSQNL